jgi:ribonuclease HII
MGKRLRIEGQQAALPGILPEAGAIATLPPELRVAGIDEVGRGCLFGPVVAAAVVIRAKQLPQLLALGVRDSKQLSASQRDRLFSEILAIALGWEIRYASVREIDRINILQASLLAMKRCVLHLTEQPDLCPDLCLVDGNQLIPDLVIPQQTMIQGDRHSPVIAAASILAKVWRDRLMQRLALKYPGYDLAANKGYGTPKHRAGLVIYGATAQHRRSFRLNLRDS